MHNVLALRYPVRVLKCLPLLPIQNRSRYAYRDIRFCTDSTVPPSEAVQANTRQVQRQDQGLVDVSVLMFGHLMGCGSLRLLVQDNLRD